MNHGRDQGDRMVEKPPDGVSVGQDVSDKIDREDLSESVVAEFASAITGFFSGRPSNRIHDSVPFSPPANELIDNDRDSNGISTWRVSILDDWCTNPPRRSDAECTSVHDEIEVDHRDRDGAPLPGSTALVEWSAGGASRSIEGLMDGPDPQDHRTPDRLGPQRAAFSPDRILPESWSSSTPTHTEPPGEEKSTDLESHGDVGLLTRRTQTDLSASDPKTDLKNSSLTGRLGLGSESGQSYADRIEPGLMLQDRVESSRINIQLGRVIADPSEFSEVDSLASRSPQASVGPSSEVKVVEPTMSNGIQADLQRMTELLEALVAESTRGRHSGIPGPSSRPHSLR